MAHSPEFTYARLLARRRDRPQARRPGDGPRRLHQGRRRRRRDRGQEGAAAGDDRQQLQRVRCALGRPRGARSGSASPRWTSRAGCRARRWWSAPPGPSARCAPGCWRWPATSSGWCRPSRRSCWPSSTTSSGRTPGPRSTWRPPRTSTCRDMDVIVTATSGAGKRVLDIMAVKPGCVITDVARPLDLSAEDVAKRPDVLVVESGEIELPGDVRMKNIGLPPGRGLRLHGRDRRAGPRGSLRDVHRGPRHRVGEGQGDLPARPQARDEAGGDLRRQRRLHRRRHRPDPRARPGAPGLLPRNWCQCTREVRTPAPGAGPAGVADWYQRRSVRIPRRTDRLFPCPGALTGGCARLLPRRPRRRRRRGRSRSRTSCRCCPPRRCSPSR